MIKRLIFGVIWFAAFYLTACLLIAAVSFVIACIHDPANALKEGHEAAISEMNSVRAYIIAGAVALSMIGAWAGILPGTGKNRIDR